MSLVLPTLLILSPLSLSPRHLHSSPLFFLTLSLHSLRRVAGQRRRRPGARAARPHRRADPDSRRGQAHRRRGATGAGRGAQFPSAGGRSAGRTKEVRDSWRTDAGSSTGAGWMRSSRWPTRHHWPAAVLPPLPERGSSTEAHCPAGAWSRQRCAPLRAMSDFFVFSL